MKTSENVLEFLRSQGFTPEIDSDNGNIFFKYQMANFLYINNDEDGDFFQLIMPSIFNVTEDNRDLILEAVNKVNLEIKVCKAGIVHDSVWLFFEIILDQSPQLEDIFPRALNTLQATRQKFYNVMN